jgi:hypothetical protein
MNIVFNLGNVLLRWGPRFLFRKLFADEARMERFLANVCNHHWNLEQDRGRSLAEAVREAMARHPEFAAEIAACDERLPTPDAAIYRLLFARNGLAASECLFIDDSARNVAGAEAVGMRGHHFTSPESLRHDLAGRGLLENRRL